MLKEHEKRFPTVKEYVSMLLPMSSNDNETISNLGAVTTGSDEEFYVVQTSDKGFRLMPGPEFSPRLYRGQWKHYPTCKASLFRKCKTYADAVYWTVKRIELGNLLFCHPALKEVMSWNFDGLRFDLNLEAVAQHYQYLTRMLDLSRSKDVAMYFATHRFSGEVGNPIPAVGSAAVLYTVDVAKFLKAQPATGMVAPIGLDPLPRPAAQKAFGLELTEGQDFEELEGVYTETFTVTEELASIYSKRVGGESSLLPIDPFEEFIDLIRKKETISKTAIETAIRVGLLPVEYSVAMVESILIKGGYEISDEIIESPPDFIISNAIQEWKQRRETYIGNIRWRGIADPL